MGGQALIFEYSPQIFAISLNSSVKGLKSKRLATPIHNTQYTIRPDILFGNDTVIDTKYKRLDWADKKPSTEDIYQMLIYNRFFNIKILFCVIPFGKETLKKRAF